MSTSSLPSFIKIHLAVLEKKSKMWKVYGRTDDDGRTDDGRCAMTIAHSSLRLRWAKKEVKLHGHKQIQRILVPCPATTLTLKTVKAWCQLKGLVTRIMHAKYLCSITNTSEDMRKVKVFVTDGQYSILYLNFDFWCQKSTRPSSDHELFRKAGDKKSWYHVKGRDTRNTHVQYENQPDLFWFESYSQG